MKRPYIKLDKNTHGIPVIFDPSGKPYRPQRDGVVAVLDVLGWSRAELARKAGKSLSTVHKYFEKEGLSFPAEVLNVLILALAGPHGDGLLPGDQVMIYNGRKPGHPEIPREEGIATLVEAHDTEGYWTVRFEEEPESTFYRFAQAENRVETEVVQ